MVVFPDFTRCYLFSSHHSLFQYHLSHDDVAIWRCLIEWCSMLLVVHSDLSTQRFCSYEFIGASSFILYHKTRKKHTEHRWNQKSNTNIRILFAYVQNRYGKCITAATAAATTSQMFLTEADDYQQNIFVQIYIRGPFVEWCADFMRCNVNMCFSLCLQIYCSAHGISAHVYQHHHKSLRVMHTEWNVQTANNFEAFTHWIVARTHTQNHVHSKY